MKIQYFKASIARYNELHNMLRKEHYSNYIRLSIIFHLTAGNLQDVGLINDNDMNWIDMLYSYLSDTNHILWNADLKDRTFFKMFGYLCRSFITHYQAELCNWEAAQIAAHG